MLCILFLRAWKCFFSSASSSFSPQDEKIRVIIGTDLLSEYRHSRCYRWVIYPKVHLSVVVWNFQFFAMREVVKNYGQVSRLAQTTIFNLCYKQYLELLVTKTVKLWNRKAHGWPEVHIFGWMYKALYSPPESLLYLLGHISLGSSVYMLCWVILLCL